MEDIVDAAIDLGIYVVIDWHDHHAEKHLKAAKAFFGHMARKYGKYDNVLYEVFNEPLLQNWKTVIKAYHEAIVPVIREYSSNLIILGTRTGRRRWTPPPRTRWPARTWPTPCTPTPARTRRRSG